jgi:flagellar basal-body rod protein FlgF
MSYGLNISASGLMTSIYAQEVWANNLANMDTPGFKPDIPSPMPRHAVVHEDGVGYLPSNKLLERLGGGTLMNRNRVDFSQGALKPTGGALDLAINGTGFFVIADPAVAGQQRLTRDGRFSQLPDGTMVTATGGLPVLDVNNRPIKLGPGSVHISGDGAVQQDGKVIAKLRVVDVADLNRLRKLDKGQFAADRAVMSGARPASGTVAQFSIEESASDEINALMRMTSAARDVEGNISMIQAHDRLMDRAINGLGRVA